MKKAIKIILTLLLITSFIAMSVTPVMAANRKTIDYVAFGDSVAAGVRGGNAPIGDPSYEAKSTYSYTNIIADDLNHSDILSNFSKDKYLCRSGMTAAELAQTCNLLLKNKSTREYNLVKNAEIITIDIGANDLLGPLYKYVESLSDIQNPDPAVLYEIISSLYLKGLEVEGNIVTILNDILAINPNVKIYVMGYYNPLPVLSEKYHVDLNMPVNILNSFIYNGNNGAIDIVKSNNSNASIIYINTMAVMANNPDSLVPADIHPTEEGYQVIAGEFWNQIEYDFSITK